MRGKEFEKKLIGKLYIEECIYTKANGFSVYKAKCTCGKDTIVSEETLLSDDDTFKCCNDCLKIVNKATAIIKDKSRKDAENLVKEKRRFGSLIIIGIDHKGLDNDGHERYYMKCKCDCGNECVIEKTLLKNGMRKSCGMHNATKDIPKEFINSYHAMKNRCHNLNDLDYGGRGITYDPRWEYFNNFKADMYDKFLDFIARHPNGERPSIERKDVNGNYCKENCDFATFKEQSNNKRNNVLYTYPFYTPDYSYTVSRAFDLLADDGLSYESIRKKLQVSTKYRNENNVVTNSYIFRNFKLRNHLGLRAVIKIRNNIEFEDYKNMDLPTNFNMHPNNKENK